MIVAGQGPGSEIHVTKDVETVRRIVSFTTTKKKMTRFKNTLNYADQLELLGIVSEALEKQKPPSPTLQRISHLVGKIVVYNNKLEMMLDDLESQYDYMLELKNKQISELKLKK